MAIKFEKVQPGMTLYDFHRESMGNTTMSQIGKWSVRIIEVNTEKGMALVSWNTNRPEWWARRKVERLSLNEPKAYRDQQERKRAR